MLNLLAEFRPLDGPAKGANLLANGEIGSVSIGQQTHLGYVELARLGIDILLIDSHIYNLANEHIVRAERDDLLHSTLDGDGRLGN